MTDTSTPIEYFKKEAKKLFKQVQANDAEAVARVQRVLKDPLDVSLMRIQHVVAVDYGFSKWEDLVKAPASELQLAISNKRGTIRSNDLPNSSGTPLGNLFRGPGIIPTSPYYAALADMFDKMTLQNKSNIWMKMRELWDYSIDKIAGRSLLRPIYESLSLSARSIHSEKKI